MTFLPLGFILFYLSPFTEIGFYKAIGHSCFIEVSRLRLWLWMFFWPTSFLQHPFPDVRRTVQDRDPLRLTRIEKTDTFEIDKIQFLQIQNDWRLAVLDFGFDLIQVPKSKFAAEPNPPLGSFNPQRHCLPAPERISLSTTWASFNRGEPPCCSSPWSVTRI